MKLPSYSLQNAKELVNQNVGKDINFTNKVSRGKVIKNSGKIMKAYNNIFTISIVNTENEEDILSFSYCDIVNNSLKLNILANEEESK